MKKIFKFYPRLRMSFILLVIASILRTIVDYFTSRVLGNVTAGISTSEVTKAVTLVVTALVVIILDVFAGQIFFSDLLRH